MGQKHWFFQSCFKGQLQSVLFLVSLTLFFFYFFNITSCNYHKLSICPFAAIPMSAEGDKAFLEKPLTVSFFTH